MAFVRYEASALAPIARTGFDVLQMRQLGPQVQDSINRLASFRKLSEGFDETATISKLDAKRDALYHVLWNGWDAAMQIDDDPFGAAAADEDSLQVA
ncbi:MAG: hypothetical protein II880_01255 [Schwartzia sp.]|nr:hypothetical protein [Schwartzia sp. (in: firmicutes)]